MDPPRVFLIPVLLNFFGNQISDVSFYPIIDQKLMVNGNSFCNKASSCFESESGRREVDLHGKTFL